MRPTPAIASATKCASKTAGWHPADLGNRSEAGRGQILRAFALRRNACNGRFCELSPYGEMPATVDFASFRLTAKCLLTPFHDVQANSCSIRAEKRGDMH